MIVELKWIRDWQQFARKNIENIFSKRVQISPDAANGDVESLIVNAGASNSTKDIFSVNDNLGTTKFLRVTKTGEIYFRGNLGAITEYGSFAVKMLAGEALTAGMVVCILQTGGTDGRAYACRTSGNEQTNGFGVVWKTAASGADVYIIVSGLALLLPDTTITATRGYCALTSSTTNGRVAQVNAATTIQNRTKKVGVFVAQGSANGAATLAMVNFG